MIKVIENFLSPEEQDNLQFLVERSRFPFFYTNQTTKEANNYASFKDKNSEDSFQFVHLMVFQKQIISEFYELIKPLVNKIQTLDFIEEYELYRVKVNLNPKNPATTSDKYFSPHVDNNVPESITAVYYINDSDGDTLFFETPKSPIGLDQEFKIIHKQTPKKGTFVYFDSEIIHTGQAPIIANYRALVNFNWAKL